MSAPRYRAEVYLWNGTTYAGAENTAPRLAQDLAAWRGALGRTVAVYRLDELGQVDALVDQRRTLADGSVRVTPPHSAITIDATWEAAVSAATDVMR